ncbi:VCBS repeat-containing protein [bacterium]|nr:VCBS repeat-containing protein [bacterium]
MKLLKRTLTLAAMTALPLCVSAELLVSESFDYPAGTITQTPNWATFGTPGSKTVMIEDSSLEYKGLPKSTGGRAIVDDEGDERVSMAIIPGVTSGTVYYSLLVNLTKIPTEKTYAMHLNGSRYSGRILFLDAGDGKYKIGISNTTAGQYADRTFSPGETVLVVVRYRFDATPTQDEVALFLDPDPSADEPAQPDVVRLDRSESLIDEFVFRQWDGVGSYEADDLRIGTTWDAAMGHEEVSQRVLEARAAMMKWAQPREANRLKYENPGLVDQLGVGLWGLPLPMDWDNDGDYDMIMSSRAAPYSGTFLFENYGTDVFGPPVELGPAKKDLTITHTSEGPIIVTPGVMYRDFSNGLFGKPESIPFKQDFYAGRVNQWEFADWEGDGDLDLMIGISDWRDYGWDDAFNEKGEWIAGPLHGHVYISINEGSDEHPSYVEPFEVQAGDSLLDTYGAPSPNYADWDGDGDMDLLCGEFLDRITFFENVGTREAPKFAEGRFLEADGKTIHMDLEMLQVDVLDWDKDGDPDIIVGEEDGRVSLIENAGKGRAKAPVYFKQRAYEIKFGALDTPWPVDWDGDGDDDIILGNTAGFIALLENLDGGSPPQFSTPQFLEADGEVIRIMAGENLSIQGPAEAKWGYTAVTVADWNSDGLPDIVTNSIIGKIVWYKNVGTRTEPKLTGPLSIELDVDGETPYPAWNWWKPEGKELVTQWRTTPMTIDMNEDGKMDLVLLDTEGFLAFYERTGDPTKTSVVSAPQRIFRMASADSTFNNNGEVESYDFNEDGVNDLLQRSLDGGVVYVSRTPIDRKTVTVTEQGMVEKGTELLTPTMKEQTLLRMNMGWAGRAGRRKYVMADWDADGDLDLLVNSRGINFLENVGKKGEFVFKDHGRITPHRLAGHTTYPTVVDWNRDGVLDLLIGAEDGCLYYYQRDKSSELLQEY